MKITKIKNYFYPNNLTPNPGLNITRINYTMPFRNCAIIELENNGLFNSLDIIKSIYAELYNLEEFKSFSYHKIIHVFAHLQQGFEITYHPSILINNNTSIEDYIKKVELPIHKLYVKDVDFYLDNIVKFTILV